MSEIGKVLGQEAEFSHGGKTYRLAGLTFEVQALWEGWLRQRARENLRLDRDSMPAAEYEAERAALRRDIDAGLYGLFSEVSATAQKTFDGLKKLTYFRVKVNHPDAAEAEVAAAVEAKIDELIELAGDMDHDPNPPGPAATAPGPATASSPSAPSSPASPGT